MARGRMLSKSLSTSQAFAQLFEIAPDMAEFCQSLYPLLVSHSDDFGRQPGDVFTVRHRVHPTSPRSLADFGHALGALAAVGLITRYVVNGDNYIEIVKFDQHQQGLHKRTKSEYPEPPGNSGKTAEIPGQPNRTELNLTEPKRSEKSGAKIAPPAALMEAWNAITVRPIPACRELTTKRRIKAAQSLRERPLSEWEDAIRRIQASAFCNGHNERGWVATFDWLLKADTAVKVLEGKYDDRPGVTAMRAPRTAAEITMASYRDTEAERATRR